MARSVVGLLAFVIGACASPGRLAPLQFCNRYWSRSTTCAGDDYKEECFPTGKCVVRNTIPVVYTCEADLKAFTMTRYATPDTACEGAPAQATNNSAFICYPVPGMPYLSSMAVCAANDTVTHAL